MKYLLLSISVLWLIQWCSAHSLSKIELKNPLNLVYQVHEDKDGHTLTISNPNLKKPTLREIIYYHVIEKPYTTKSSSEEPSAESSGLESDHPFTNGQGFPYPETELDNQDQAVDDNAKPEAKKEENLVKKATDDLSVEKVAEIIHKHADSKAISRDEKREDPEIRSSESDPHLRLAEANNPLRRRKREITVQDTNGIKNLGRKNLYKARITPYSGKLQPNVYNAQPNSSETSPSSSKILSNKGYGSGYLGKGKVYVTVNHIQLGSNKGNANLDNTYGMDDKGNSGHVWNNLQGHTNFHVGNPVNSDENSDSQQNSGSGSNESDNDSSNSSGSSESSGSSSGSDESPESSNVTGEHDTVNSNSNESDSGSVSGNDSSSSGSGEGGSGSVSISSESNSGSGSGSGESNSGSGEGDSSGSDSSEGNNGSDEGFGGSLHISFGNGEDSNGNNPIISLGSAEDSNGNNPIIPDKDNKKELNKKFEQILDDLHDIFVKGNTSVGLPLTAKDQNLNLLDIIHKIFSKIKNNNRISIPGVEVDNGSNPNNPILSILEGVLPEIIKNNITVNNNVPPNSNKSDGYIYPKKDENPTTIGTNPEPTTTSSPLNQPVGTENLNPSKVTEPTYSPENSTEEPASEPTEIPEQHDDGAGKGGNPNYNKPLDENHPPQESTTEGTENPEKYGNPTEPSHKGESPNQCVENINCNKNKPDKIPVPKPSGEKDKPNDSGEDKNPGTDYPGEDYSGDDSPGDDYTEDHYPGSGEDSSEPKKVTQPPNKEPEKINCPGLTKDESKPGYDTNKKLDSMMELMNNEKFWKFMGLLGEKYLEALTERTKNFIKDEVAAQINKYFKEHKLNADKEQVPQNKPQDNNNNNENPTTVYPNDIESGVTENPINSDDDRYKKDVPKNPVNVKAGSILSNTIGKNKVNNIYIFYANKNITEIMKNIKDLVKGTNGTNIFSFENTCSKPGVEAKKEPAGKPDNKRSTPEPTISGESTVPSTNINIDVTENIYPGTERTTVANSHKIDITTPAVEQPSTNESTTKIEEPTTNNDNLVNGKTTTESATTVNSHEVGVTISTPLEPNEDNSTPGFAITTESQNEETGSTTKEPTQNNDSGNQITTETTIADITGSTLAEPVTSIHANTPRTELTTESHDVIGPAVATSTTNSDNGSETTTKSLAKMHITEPTTNKLTNEDISTPGIESESHYTASTVEESTSNSDNGSKTTTESVTEADITIPTTKEAISKEDYSTPSIESTTEPDIVMTSPPSVEVPTTNAEYKVHSETTTEPNSRESDTAVSLTGKPEITTELHDKVTVDEDYTGKSTTASNLSKTDVTNPSEVTTESPEVKKPTTKSNELHTMTTGSATEPNEEYKVTTIEGQKPTTTEPNIEDNTTTPEVQEPSTTESNVDGEKSTPEAQEPFVTTTDNYISPEKVIVTTENEEITSENSESSTTEPNVTEIVTKSEVTKSDEGTTASEAVTEPNTATVTEGTGDDIITGKSVNSAESTTKNPEDEVTKDYAGDVTTDEIATVSNEDVTAKTNSADIEATTKISNQTDSSAESTTINAENKVTTEYAGHGTTVEIATVSNEDATAKTSTDNIEATTEISNNTSNEPPTTSPSEQDQLATATTENSSEKSSVTEKADSDG